MMVSVFVRLINASFGRGEARECPPIKQIDGMV